MINIFCLLGLAFAYSALFVSPEKFWVSAFFGLSFPILLLVNLFFFFFWLIFKWKFALFSGVFILAGFTKLTDLFQWRTSPETQLIEKWKDQDSTIEVLSYNVRLFDLYNWSNNKLTRNSIMDLIQKENADIICLQEFFYEDAGKFNTLDTLLQIQQATNYHIEHSAHVKKVNHWGIATFSKYPIVSKGMIHFKDSSDNISMFTDVKAFGDTIRIYNLHLESIRFREKEYKAIKEITEKETNPSLEDTKTIISRLRRAFIRRARQTDVISKHIADCPYPVIVCGDFNDTPNSYTYHQIANGLTDAFQSSGSGLGSTYTGSIPFLRIDYILHSPNKFKSLYFDTNRKKYSDHFPISSILEYHPNASAP